MKLKTGTILLVMNVLTWLAFLGLCVKAGAILISYGISVKNPEASRNLYMGMDLSPVMHYDFWQYTGLVLSLITILILQAYAALVLTRVLSKIKMASPFTMEVSRLLEKISYIILLVWVSVLLHDAHIGWLAKNIGGLEEHYISGEFIFAAGVVFVIAQIFKKGVEIQSENELTV